MMPIRMERDRIVGVLVWLKGPRGPHAEKRPRDMSENKTPAQVEAQAELVLVSHPLTAGEYSLQIAILEQRYPPPSDK